MKERKTPRLWEALPWIWLVAAWAGAVAFTALWGRTCLDSDMASEMVLASQLNREGGILSTNWYYSTELRVFCEQLLFKVGLMIFPDNWHLARVLAQAVLLAALAGSYLFFARGVGLRGSGAWGAAALMCPFGFWYLFHGIFGGFYLPHMILLLLSLGLALRLVRAKTLPRALGAGALLAAVCGAAGLNGVRLIMNLYLPLVLTALVLLWLGARDAGFARSAVRRELRLTGASLLMLAASGAGYLVNTAVLARNHHFSAQEQRTWLEMSFEKLADTWLDFLSLFGYPLDSSVFEIGGQTSTIALFSVSGVLGAFGIVLAGAVAVSLVRLLVRHRELSFEQNTVVFLLAAILVVDGMIFAWTHGKQEVNASHWLPVVPLAFAVLQMEGETEHFRLPHARRWLASAFAACVLLCSAGTVDHFLNHTPRARKGMTEACGWLMEQGYSQGIATFWNSNVLTELSNGEIEMWTVGNLETPYPQTWLQSTAHDAFPEGPVFVLLYGGETALDLPYASADGSDVVYRDGNGFVILAYDSVEPLIRALEGA